LGHRLLAKNLLRSVLDIHNLIYLKFYLKYLIKSIEKVLQKIYDYGIIVTMCLANTQSYNKLHGA